MDNGVGIIGNAISRQVTESLADVQLRNAKALAGNLNQQELATIEQTSQDFEAVFISQMLNIMFDTIPTDGMFGGGNAEQTYRALLVDEYGSIMAQTGGIGISESVQAELLRAQGGAI